MCYLILAMDRFVHLKSEVSDLKLLCESVSRQLGAWAFSLQEGDIKGAKFLTDQGREGYQQKIKGDAIAEQLKLEHEERLEKLKLERKK